MAQQRTGVNASEILFVENSKGHVKVAKELGWQTFFYGSANMEKASLKLGLVLDSVAGSISIPDSLKNVDLEKAVSKAKTMRFGKRK